MSTELPETQLLSTPLRWRIDQLCDQFEATWQSGTVPSIPATLEDIEAAGRRALLQELIILDLGYRWSQAPSESSRATAAADAPPGLPARPRLEDYLAVFPQLGSLEQLPLAVIWEELQVRDEFAERPSHAECAARFAGPGALRHLGRFGRRSPPRKLAARTDSRIGLAHPLSPLSQPDRNPGRHAGDRYLLQ